MRHQRDDFGWLLRAHLAKHPGTNVPTPPRGCQLRRINADGSITYVTSRVIDDCNVWRDYYDQYGRKHTIPEPEGGV